MLGPQPVHILVRTRVWLPGCGPFLSLRANSPALNAGDAATSVARDQHGVARPQASGPDMGAYESEVNL